MNLCANTAALREYERRQDEEHQYERGIERIVADAIEGKSTMLADVLDEMGAPAPLALSRLLIRLTKVKDEDAAEILDALRERLNEAADDELRAEAEAAEEDEAESRGYYDEREYDGRNDP